MTIKELKELISDYSDETKVDFWSGDFIYPFTVLGVTEDTKNHVIIELE